MPLHPVAAKMIADSKTSGRPNAHLLPVEVARANFEADFGALAKPDILEAREVAIDVRDGQIRGRLYRPIPGDHLPLIVYFHGGGWLLGSIDSHDCTTRKLSNASGCAVLSVDYRRGPDSRFPTAVHDALDAISWALDHSDDLGIDAERFAVAGDSAGGNLATVAAIALRDAGGPQPRAQLLVYPVTTCDLTIGFDMQWEGHMLYRDEMQWHQDNYLAGPEDGQHAWVSPLGANLVGLPPTMVLLAECDPIRPQGALYAEALAGAGVDVEVHDAPTMVHGYFGLDELFPEAEEYMEIAGRWLAGRLEA